MKLFKNKILEIVENYEMNDNSLNSRNIKINDGITEFSLGSNLDDNDNELFSIWEELLSKNELSDVVLPMDLRNKFESLIEKNKENDKNYKKIDYEKLKAKAEYIKKMSEHGK